MKPRSAIKSDLFAAESRAPKIDSLGDPLVKISRVVDFSALASEVDRPSSTVSGLVFRKAFGFQWFRGGEVRLCNGTFPGFFVDFAPVFGVE